MKIVYPEMFWLLLIAVPVVAILAMEYFRGRRELPVIGGTGGQETTKTVWLVKWFFSGLFFLAFLGFTTLSLVGFTWGSRPVQTSRSGLDIALVMDVSRSMLADDVRPSRLQRAAVVFQGLLSELRNSRFSMIIFKGGAVRMVPMTEDATVIESVLAFAGPGMISTPGTDLALGLETALESFPEGSDRNRIVILVTDGEFLDRSPVRVAADAGYRGIPILSVAAGSRAGSTIILSDGSSVKNTEGQVVVSRLNLEVLNQISDLSGGRVFVLADADILSQVLSEVRRYDTARRTQGFRLVEVRRYRLFLTLALLFLLLSVGIRTVRWKNAF